MPGNPIVPRWTEPSIPARWIETGAAVSGPQLPLAGVVVLDFTVYWAGPSATRRLADLIAHIDARRTTGVLGIDAPRSPTPWSSSRRYFHKMNRNKESVAIDLQTEAGRDAHTAN